MKDGTVCVCVLININVSISVGVLVSACEFGLMTCGS